ncbi:MULTISPECIES: hypothetical protein [Brenneria]|uniref:Lipoprotein n=1 Tax=Brenneria nigrifluens DSM 30175 = ATCC 13028 TaxID=1121120 RepID=A0A2U1UCR8_9GAMM|nr:MULTISPECIES: hypothetical protein [Brenneria]EHD20435.1 putative lipoprotein [Brenneria sp. EniD312]PWC19364.1 hypothetical protein DDT54_22225 [Brenneria nigrifluens DSM 30175 = ATCC 13028]QCR03637.1 hypothetical protein EH206_05140 [Brenneria nigrifluens DSM 30175 = ATCC 13028]
MFTRRKFILATSGAFIFPALPNQALASQAVFKNDQVSRDIQQALLTHFKDGKLSASLTAHIIDVGLDWQLPEIEVSKIDCIVAYAFGNRPNKESAGGSAGSSENLVGLPDPGPTNEALADTVYQIYKLKPVPIYAQWEIARFLTSKYKLDKELFSVEPVKNSDGTITYLSTDGVAKAIVDKEGSAEKLGNVAVVAHQDHAKRCIQTSNSIGLRSFAVKEVALPTQYDELSGQPWTRDRETYLLHDMFVQMRNLRDKRIKALYPQD